MTYIPQKAQAKTRWLVRKRLCRWAAETRLSNRFSLFPQMQKAPRCLPRRRLRPAGQINTVSGYDTPAAVNPGTIGNIAS